MSVIYVTAKEIVGGKVKLSAPGKGTSTVEMPNDPKQVAEALESAILAFIYPHKKYEVTWSD